MTSQYHVSELDAINGTKLRPKSRPESGPSWDQVLFKSPTQSSTQLHKISSSKNGIKSVTIQVGEQVTDTNHREHRGHRDFVAEAESTAKVAVGVAAKVTTYLEGSKT